MSSIKEEGDSFKEKCWIFLFRYNREKRLSGISINLFNKYMAQVRWNSANKLFNIWPIGKPLTTAQLNKDA